MLGAMLAGQYRVVSLIGVGGMGVVYRARQLTVDRDVAIKIIRKDLAHDAGVIRRFENESKIISRLRHPNTLRLYDCRTTADGEVFIVTELLSGRPLSAVLEEGERLPADRAVRILDAVCGSLSEAHAAGIVHRDLKPQNIFIDRVGNEDVVKVLDFGIAKLAGGGSAMTGSGGLIGTPLYMSPEQAKGDPVDQRSDIYSLGVVTYHMLAGAPPFVGETPVAVLYKHLEAVPPRFESVGVPPGLDALMRSMLEKSPSARPQSIDAVRAALGTISGTGVASAPRNRRIWAIAAVVFAAVLVASAIYVLSLRTEVPVIVRDVAPPPPPQPVHVEAQPQLQPPPAKPDPPAKKRPAPRPDRPLDVTF
jgi:serine/threonine-protein kinase